MLKQCYQWRQCKHFKQYTSSLQEIGYRIYFLTNFRLFFHLFFENRSESYLLAKIEVMAFSPREVNSISDQFSPFISPFFFENPSESLPLAKIKVMAFSPKEVNSFSDQFSKFRSQFFLTIRVNPIPWRKSKWQHFRQKSEI